MLDKKYKIFGSSWTPLYVWSGPEDYHSQENMPPYFCYVISIQDTSMVVATNPTFKKKYLWLHEREAAILSAAPTWFVLIAHNIVKAEMFRFRPQNGCLHSDYFWYRIISSLSFIISYLPSYKLGGNLADNTGGRSSPSVGELGGLVGRWCRWSVICSSATIPELLSVESAPTGAPPWKPSSVRGSCTNTVGRRGRGRYSLVCTAVKINEKHIRIDIGLLLIRPQSPQS